MKLRMILFIKLVSYLLFACTKPSSSPIPLNPNIEYRVLDTTFKKFYFEYDFDYNGVREMTVSVNFKKDNGDGMESASGLIQIPNGFVQNFDVMDTGLPYGSDTFRYAKRISYGDSIYYKPGKWIASKAHSGGLNLFNYEKFTPMSIDKKGGYYNSGEVYIPIRFYARFDYGEGWYNAWMLLNTTTENIAIKSIAWYKTPETPIKAGEK